VHSSEIVAFDLACFLAYVQVELGRGGSALRSGIAAVSARAASRASFHAIMIVCNARGAVGAAIIIGRPHSTKRSCCRFGASPFGCVKRPMTTRSWTRARVMNGSSPFTASVRQLAESAGQRPGMSNMAILCRLQKSRTWRCAACERRSDSCLSSRSTLCRAAPRANEACGTPRPHSHTCAKTRDGRAAVVPRRARFQQMALIVPPLPAARRCRRSFAAWPFQVSLSIRQRWHPRRRMRCASEIAPTLSGRGRWV
jgi:hypothetical protein